MNLPVILSIAVVLIVIILAFRIVKGALKFVFTVLGVVLLIGLLLGVLVYMDAQQAKDLMEEGDKVILYSHGDDVVAGVRVTGEGLLAKGEGALPDGMTAMGGEERGEYEKLLEEDEPKEDELLVVVRNGTLANASAVTVQEVSMTQEEFRAFMVSDEPKSFIAAKATDDAPEEAVLDGLSPFTDDELKASVFMANLAAAVDDQGSSFLLDAIRDERVRVEPTFSTIWMLRHLPTEAVAQEVGGFINATTGET
mgnify:CR=1 FL=1